MGTVLPPPGVLPAMGLSPSKKGPMKLTGKPDEIEAFLARFDVCYISFSSSLKGGKEGRNADTFSLLTDSLGMGEG